MKISLFFGKINEKSIIPMILILKVENSLFNFPLEHNTGKCNKTKKTALSNSIEKSRIKLW